MIEKEKEKVKEKGEEEGRGKKIVKDSATIGTT